VDAPTASTEAAAAEAGAGGGPAQQTVDVVDAKKDKAACPTCGVV